MAGHRGKRDADSIFWVSLADLNTSLMMCFLVVFLGIAYLSAKRDEENKKKLSDNAKEGVAFHDAAKKLEAAKGMINQAIESAAENIRKEFRSKCEGVSSIVANKEELSLTVEFKSSDLSWFAPDVAKPKASGETCLKAFVPMWLGEIYALESGETKLVDQLIIEGHTDSTSGKDTDEDPYLYNLRLSQNRSLEVAKYILDFKKGIPRESYLNYLRIQKDWDGYVGWLKSHLTATGRSYSQLRKIVNSSGVEVEDKDKSRRVEFRIILKDQLKIIEQMTTRAPSDVGKVKSGK